MQNGTETALDCGGDCAACADGLACNASGDCTSGVCVNNACAAPACDDGVQNGDESDVDCGGTCAGCDDGSACGFDADCASGLCEAGACVPEPRCDDGIQNGTETDLDCGGNCLPCAPEGTRVGHVDLGMVTGLSIPTGWLAFYTPDAHVELTHVGVDIRSLRGEHQIQCFVYSRDPNVVDDNTFRMDLFDEIIGRTEPIIARHPGHAYLALDRPVELAPREYGLGCTFIGPGENIVIAMDREGDRRFCYINAAQFPFANDVPPDEWRAGQPNARMGIFGVINDDFVGPAL